MRDACEASGPGFGERLRAAAAAYVAFAIRSPALLNLMNAAKPHDDGQELQGAASVMSLVRGLITDGIADGVLAARDPERYAFLLFAWVRGIASLVTSGLVGPDTADELLADSITTFVHGSGTS
jgi:AcrR family transcriptional regulator